ncbi:MAG: MFS transporter [Acidimicrobiaceae bacterium]|nr:MFS transporter [Acidimicrobiaceae bacterium]
MSSGSVAIASGSVQRHSPWLAVAGVCGVYVSFGLAIGVMAPLVDEISSDLSLSRSAMGSILGAWALIYVFTAVPGGAVVDRLGLRWSLLVGSLTITTSLLLRSMANGPVSLFAAVAVFGIGGPLVSIATPKLVASLFDADERRLPTGLGVSSPALGTAIALAVTNPILLPAFDGNWRPVLVVMAAVSFLTTLGWLYASRAITHVEQGATRTDRSTIARLLKLRSMRTILAITLFSFFFSHALSNWLPEILADTGQSDNAAGYLSAISVTVGIVGSLSIARLVPSPRRPLALVVIFVVAGLMVAGIGSLPFVLLLVALALLGFARAGIIPLLFLEIMGDKNIAVSDIGAATGLFFAVGEIGGFSGPYVIGWVADTTEGFAAATLVLTGIAGAAAAGALALKFVRGTTDVY